MAELGYQESIGSLVKGIITDIRQLIRDEVALARVEMREQASRAKLAISALGAAAAAMTLGLVFLLIALSVGIADLLGWPLWAGFLAVALLLGVAGFVMFSMGRRKMQSVHAVPEQTVQTVKENSEWIAKRLSSVKR
jgi:protein-S-isoprenylcysteine O-methyltransferase Ste14